jgi:hypothetical protein
MANRTQEQNEDLLLGALRKAGDQGLSIEDARAALSTEAEQSKSLAKKLLEHLRTKGCARVKMGKTGLCYVIIPGR